MDVSVMYVDGCVAEAETAGWPTLPADGLDRVDLDDGAGSYRMQGQSVYWVRREGPLWILGGGQVTAVQEVLAYGDGRFEFTRPAFMPDLDRDVVKLGWWLPCR